MKYRIYYEAGRVRSWKAGVPDPMTEMPDFFGIQAILQDRGDEHNTRLHIISGHDFYLLDISGYWVPIDHDSLIERLMFHRHKIKCVLKGFCLPQPEFRVIYEQAKADKETETLD